MLKRKEYSTKVAGQDLVIEVSSLAEQANAAVIAKYGETIVLATVVMEKGEESGDYLPLRVDYEEKFYAAGKIIGSRFVRRESRPSEDAILAGRLVDRTIRPLFNQKIRRDIQVVVTVLSYDEENDPEFVGLMGASVALGISDVPWNGPVAGVRVAEIEGKLVINPKNSDLKEKKIGFDSFVAGSRGLINMIELGGSNADEKNVVAAFSEAQKEIDKLVDFEEKIIKEIGKPKTEVFLFEPDAELKKLMEEYLKDKLEAAIYVPDKIEQKGKIGELKHALFEHIKEVYAAKEKSPDFKSADFLFEEAINDLVHKNVLEKERRPDGRKTDEVRALYGEVGLFKRPHGSSLFMRGNTQALAITTLAPPGQEQIMESMESTTKRRFMLHYNFPPFSTGETGGFRGPGRREIGHGNLARKAVEPLIPSKDIFPYTIRVVSEILSSNGSSSMATVCASVMSLMDAGVPITQPAAGIAMGLMLEKTEKSEIPKSKFKVLTDIQGPEDHHGDMDFKAAGTEDGVNAVQMDVKVNGLTVAILEKVLEQAKKARLEILGVMKKVIPTHKAELSPFVPAIRIIKINPEKIGMVIGPGGKVINGMIDKFGLAGIDIDEDGSVFVSGNDLAMVEEAVNEIQTITKEFKVGEIIEGSIIKTLEVGAIVDLGGGRDGMIHISELKNGYVKTVQEVVKAGDFVRAKIIRVGDDGRIGLSMKQL